ncbi:MAG TPA: hypothetical protein VFE76_07000 [Myxococcales bacterium]|nr:hypothetical protein [Myxococcales bacterium]
MLERELEVRLDVRERVVHLVRHPRREHAYRHHAVGNEDPLLHLALAAQISRDGRDGWFPVLVEGEAGHFDGEGAAVLEEQLGLDGSDGLPHAEPHESRSHARAIGLDDQADGIASQHLFDSRKPQVSQANRVCVQNAAVAVQHDCLRQVLNQAAEAPFGEVLSSFGFRTLQCTHDDLSHLRYLVFHDAVIGAGAQEFHAAGGRRPDDQERDSTRFPLGDRHS